MKWIKATRKYRTDFLCEYTLECSHRTATLSGETRRNFKGVCQKLNTELPDFSLAFSIFSPDSPSKLKKTFLVIILSK